MNSNSVRQTAGGVTNHLVARQGEEMLARGGLAAVLSLAAFPSWTARSLRAPLDAEDIFLVIRNAAGSMKAS